MPTLSTLELPFVYEEHGETKSALVKIVLCQRCVKKLMWKRQQEKEQNVGSVDSGEGSAGAGGGRTSRKRRRAEDDKDEKDRRDTRTTFVSSHDHHSGSPAPRSDARSHRYRPP
jgi:protein FRA10AC1